VASPKPPSFPVVEPTLNIGQPLFQRSVFRASINLVFFLGGLHPRQTLAAQRQLDGGGRFQPAAERSLFENALRRDGARGVGGFQFFQRLDAEHIAQKMLDEVAGDGIGHLHFGEQGLLAHFAMPARSWRAS
jgi:hypothetical protein